MKIGRVVEHLEISADTLRYYEKIHLLPRVSRDASGVRQYGKKDLSRLRFIKRAQRMGFKLDEIASLLSFRENPQKAKPQVRELAGQKLAEIEEHLTELSTLHNELQLLCNLCGADADGCPILDQFDSD